MSVNHPTVMKRMMKESEPSPGIRSTDMDGWRTAHDNANLPRNKRMRYVPTPGNISQLGARNPLHENRPRHRTDIAHIYRHCRAPYSGRPRYDGPMTSPDSNALRLLPIRTATAGDLDAIDAAEQACFPPVEAASRGALAARLAVYPDHFWLLEGVVPESVEPDHDGDADRENRGNSPTLGAPTLISFVNGMTTDEPHLLDAMYDDPSLHSPDGAWQMIFGVDTHPALRRHGYAGMVLRHVIDDARSHGRRGLVLTCKDRLVHYYASFGFQDEGLSDSTHGGVTWHEMRLVL